MSLDFRIPSRLNLPKKILFLTYDEAIPCLVFFFVCFFLLQLPLIGAGLAVGWVFLIKHLKKGHDSDYLLIRLQRFLPFSCFKNIPKSSDDFWLF